MSVRWRESIAVSLPVGTEKTFDSDNDLIWSARKGVRAGDLVFVYRTAPRSAITDVFEVTNDSYFEPWEKWDGFWMEMSRMCRIKFEREYRCQFFAGSQTIHGRVDFFISDARTRRYSCEPTVREP